MSNSTAKYQHFPLVDENEKTKKPVSKDKSRILFWAVVSLLAVSTIVVIFAAVGIGIGLSLSRASPPSASGLTVITCSQEELEGIYHTQNNSIAFHSVTSTSGSFVNLTVTSASGEVLIHILHKSNMTMVEGDGAFFFVAETNSVMEEYVILEGHSEYIESMIMTEQVDMSNEMMTEILDNETVSVESQIALQHLANSQEAELIIKAGRALEGSCMQNESDSLVAVRAFYTLTYELANTRSSLFTDPDIKKQHQYHDQQSHQRGRDHCTKPHDMTCPMGKCPYSFHSGDYVNGCFGMCGPGCWCWSRLCGDCCVHEYCLTHDNCCRKGILKCFSVVWKVLVDGFHCEDTFRC